MKKILFPALIAIVFVLVACGGGASEGDSASLEPVPPEYAGKSNPLSPDAAVIGAEIYAVNCTACHGERGLGDGPAGAALNPPPGNLVDLNKVAGDDFLFWRIAEGSPGTSMVPWKGILNEEQIWQVVAFIRTLK